jgi:hypothetical protein
LTSRLQATAAATTDDSLTRGGHGRFRPVG